LNGKPVGPSIIQPDSSVDIANSESAFQANVTRVIFQPGLQLSKSLWREADPIVIHFKQDFICAVAPGSDADRASLSFVVYNVLESILEERLQDQFKDSVISHVHNQIDL
jgi:hypothetical protein